MSTEESIVSDAIPTTDALPTTSNSTTTTSTTTVPEAAAANPPASNPSNEDVTMKDLSSKAQETQDEKEKSEQPTSVVPTSTTAIKDSSSSTSTSTSVIATVTASATTSTSTSTAISAPNSSQTTSTSTGQSQSAKRKSKDKSKRKSKKKKVTKKKGGMKRIQSEFKEMMLNPPVGCSAGPKGDNMMEWIATIDGPPNTPYENGKFFLSIKFPKEYPFQPPNITFKTRIYHCNVDRNGAICLDILKDQWSPALTVSKVLLSIIALLQEPNPTDPLVADIARLYLTNLKEHEANAKEWTRRYASV